MKKKRIFITTVLRASLDENITGYLMELDFAAKRVIKKIPIPKPDKGSLFWNPRGGDRGGRGLFYFDGILYVCTATSILKFDTNLNLIGKIHNKKLGGLHSLHVDKEGITVTSTIHDLILTLDLNGKETRSWLGSQSPYLQKRFNYKSRNLDFVNYKWKNSPKAYKDYFDSERLHLNFVDKYKGNIYAFARRQGALINISCDPERVIIANPNRLAAPHDGQFTPDGNIIVNETGRQRIFLYGTNGKVKKIINTKLYGKEISRQFARAGWQRGLTHLSGNTYLVGTSPLTVFAVDVKQSKIKRVYNISNEVHHCVFGICVAKDF